MSTTDLDRLTQQHINRGNHLHLLAHVESVTGMTPDVRMDESREYSAAIWWESTITHTFATDEVAPVAYVATEFDDNMTVAKHYVYINLMEGEFTSVAKVVAELGAAQTILEQIQRAAETFTMPPERHAQRLS